MIKVTLWFGGLLVLGTAAILQTSGEPQILDGCKSESELWGSVDGTKFYFCIGDNKSVEQTCPPNTFFVQNATVSGCIPLRDVADNCVYHRETQPCEGVYLTQPQTHEDPQKFYLCPKAGAEPIPLNCSKGAFVHEDNYLGCFDWAEWRHIRGCEL